MRLQDSNAKQNLLTRLRRIEGQVRGVQHMIEEDRDCHDIIQQLTAVRSAVQGASLALLKEYASDCLLNTKKASETERKELLDDLIVILGKMP